MFMDELLNIYLDFCLESSIIYLNFDNDNKIF